MKTSYLQAMGIVSWRLRSVNVQPLQCYYSYYLSAPGNENQGAVLLAQPGGSPQQEQELLSAIIQALGFQAKPVPALAALSRIPGFIILGSPPNELPAVDFTIVTASLEDMLNNPLLKATVWQALRRPWGNGNRQ